MASESWATPWIAHGTQRSTPTARLFCFTCAGGGASSYRDWGSHFPETVEVCPIQLPGRETRVSEPKMTDLLAIVDELGEALEGMLDIPFVLFGHSLGGLLAFEVARDLRKHGHNCAHLFIAATPAAHLPRTRPPVHRLSDDDLLAYLRDMQGTPKEVLEREWLVRMHLPVLRADMQCLETYGYGREPVLNMPISVFGGLRDEQVSSAGLLAWSAQTSAELGAHWYDGGHFFVQANAPAIAAEIVGAMRW